MTGTAAQAPSLDPDFPQPDPARLFGGIALSARDAVIVAVSGGSDSLALLFLLKRYLDESHGRTRPIAVTVDHGLRPQSAAEALGVARIAGAIGVEHRTVAWEGPKPVTAVSAAAREARHRLLAGAARAAGTDLVLTGHTMDDQAETVAMRLRRGEGRGMAGIAAATLYDGRCWFVRPLLWERRGALRRYLTSADQDWIDDPSNADSRYERARLRAELTSEAVAELAEQASEAALRREMLGDRAAALIAATARMAAPGLMRLEPDFVAAGEREAATYALRILLAAAGGREQLPDADKTAQLLEGLARPPFRATLARAVVDARKAGIFVYRERRGLPQPRPFEPGIWDGRYRIEGEAPGTGVAPAGGAGTVSDVSSGDAPASLLSAAHAARPGLWRDGAFERLLDEEAAAACRALPLVAPWGRYLPCFDIAPARAAAALLGADEIPPPPLARHNRAKA